jgi:UDP-N-acetylglucosamine:LPS N-acetylglucosamine transferase
VVPTPEFVVGPRLDPRSLPAHPGLEVRPYVERLHEHFAVSDLGAVQGGLTTTMELTAARRPFLYFPLGNHFEQVYHVAYRLDRYQAGTRVDYHATSSEQLAEAMFNHIGADTSHYHPVQNGAAARAAREIAALLQ